MEPGVNVALQAGIFAAAPVTADLSLGGAPVILAFQMEFLGTELLA